AGASASAAALAAADDGPAEVDPGAMLVRLLRRTGYGVRPEDLEYVSAMGFDAYLNEQLNPATLDDSTLAAEAARLIPSPQIQNFTFAQLYQRNQEYPVRLELLDMALLRAIYSRRQLLERMVEFWHDHFSMDSNITFGGFFQAIKDRDVIRPNALGTFYNLLLASCTNPGMLTFLTNVTNIAARPNENFGRELMELHTLGVDGGYTQQDVMEVSRCFTGWTIVPAEEPSAGGTFYFNPDTHDYDEKVVLGYILPGGQGIEDGMRVVQILADHPATSFHVARKLCRWFLEETPRESTVQRAALRFRQTRGDLREVVRAILTPENLFGVSAKFKRPFHLVASGARAIRTHIDDMWFLRAAMREGGHPMFEWGPPDGFPDTVQYWGGGQMARWNYGCTLGENQILGLQSDASVYFQGMSGVDEVIAEISRRFYQNELSASDEQYLREFLAVDPDNDRHRRATTGLMMAMHGFQWY
ncbi:MAG: DUF1800 domain-containing protein, partial [Phycisphaerales bacterium]